MMYIGVPSPLWAEYNDVLVRNALNRRISSCSWAGSSVEDSDISRLLKARGVSGGVS